MGSGTFLVMSDPSREPRVDVVTVSIVMIVSVLLLWLGIELFSQ